LADVHERTDGAVIGGQFRTGSGESVLLSFVDQLSLSLQYEPEGLPKRC
jgi:hypothetical protein